MRSIFFAVLFFALPAYSANLCLEIFRDNGPVIQTGTPLYYRDATIFAVEVPELSYTFEGYLNPSGRLSITARLTYPEFHIRSHLSGAKLYSEMIAHFGLERIQSIEGHWAYGDNYQQYFAGLAKGLNPPEAALATWSGQQAQRFGFTKVESIESRNMRSGSLGIVTVIFVRP